MKNTAILFCAAILFLLPHGRLSAQCSTSGTPSYSSGCTSEYLTSVSASGTGVTSTVSYSGSSCAGSYFNYFSTQGITAPTGSTITFNVNRCAGYLAYLSIFVDWNNDGTYETTELVGSTYTYASFATTATYTFTIPLTGIVTNTNLHMRVFLGEPTSGGTVSAPCSARWGESCDYFLDATCTTPTLTVTPSSALICGAGSAALAASGAGATPTYIWSPAASLSASTGANVVATPAANTTYTLTGYGPGVCQATNTANVAIAALVPPAITPGGPTTFCQGGNVLLSETSGAGVSYQWYAGSSSIPGATNSSYTAAPMVTTTYSVAVTNAAGCVAGTTATITILPTPPAVITPAGPTTVCSPQQVLLNADAAAGYTYQWYNTAGLIGGATAQNYTANTTDAYKAVVTAATGCKDTSVPVNITIHPSPVAFATASGPLTFCSYDSVVLTGAFVAGVTYQWLNGTIPIGGATNISYTANTPGTYDYRLKVTNVFGCSDTTANGLFDVTVNPAPVPVITSSGSLTICADSTVILSTTNVPGNTYQWYFGATPSGATIISSGPVNSYTASVTGYYYVTVITSAGCVSTSQSAADLVTSVAIPHITYGTPLDFCWGSNVDLSLGISASTTGISYQWMNDGINIPGANASDFSAQQSGHYSCFVNIGGGCLTTTDTVPVTVSPLPNPVIFYSGGYLQTANIYTSYQWYCNMSAITGSTGYEVHPTTNGDYTVIVVDTNGCQSEADMYPLVGLATAQIKNQNSPVIYPNPATTMLYITYREPVNATISTIDGKKLMETYSTKEIDISELPQGIYMIVLYDKTGNTLLAEKLVKQ